MTGSGGPGRPLVSVIAVCYNHARFIIECLDSIRCQTLTDKQLIVIDDCSQDGSPSLIHEWIEHHGVQCTFIAHRENRGLCRTLNEALAHAEGKYLSLVATDDVLMPEKLERQVELMERLPLSTGVVYSDAFLIDMNGNQLPSTFLEFQLGRPPNLPEGNLFPKLLEWDFIPIMTALIRRECVETVGSFDEQLASESYDFWLRVAHRFQFAASPYLSAKYRLLPDSMFRGSLTRILEDDLVIYSRWLGLRSDWDRVIRRSMASRGWWLYQQDHPRRREYVRLMLRYSHGPRSLMRFIVSLGGSLRWSHLDPIKPLAVRCGILRPSSPLVTHLDGRR